MYPVDLLKVCVDRIHSLQLQFFFLIESSRLFDITNHSNRKFVDSHANPTSFDGRSLYRFDQCRLDNLPC